ncbi:lysozyme inhibitor LprI family protein [Paraburkholderia sp. MM6662-R1]|uniref:lysozyme inhibitor LprI family protein n=1 Tax=Paraburkholderia sp. MM6662-R1 TaxID=2991066 RepID=UPI003D24FA0B
MKFRNLILVAITITPLFAHADDKLFSKQLVACMNRANGVTPDRLNCMAAETDAQKKLLTTNYARLMKLTEPERKAQLENAQRAWIKWRDANCGFYEDPANGTGAEIEASSCLLNTTAVRANELRDLADEKARSAAQ